MAATNTTKVTGGRMTPTMIAIADTSYLQSESDESIRAVGP